MKEDRNALLRRGGRSAGSKDWSEHDVVALLDGYDLTLRTTRSRRYKPRDFWRRVKAAAISLGAEPSRTENAYENKFKRLRREYRLFKQGSLQDGRVEIEPFVGKLAGILDAGGHAPGASAMSDDSEHTGKDAMTPEVGPSVRRETRNSRARANMEERLAAAAAQEAADAAQEGSGSASPLADTPLPESSQAGAVGAQASDRETAAEAEAEDEAGAQQEGLKVLKEVTRELLGAAERQRQWEREAWRKDREVLDEIRDQNERMLRLLCGFILDREDLVAPIVNAELGLQTQTSRPPR